MRRDREMVGQFIQFCCDAHLSVVQNPYNRDFSARRSFWPHQLDYGTSQFKVGYRCALSQQSSSFTDDWNAIGRNRNSSW